MSKSRDAFRTISEVSDWLDTPAHVLRFWESKFAQVKPVKRAGGRRYYRPQDMSLLGGIKKLLHEDGLTIKGVQKLLRENGIKHVAALAPELPWQEDGKSAPATTKAEPVAEPDPTPKETETGETKAKETQADETQAEETQTDMPGDVSITNVVPLTRDAPGPEGDGPALSVHLGAKDAAPAGAEATTEAANAQDSAADAAETSDESDADTPDLAAAAASVPADPADSSSKAPARLFHHLREIEDPEAALAAHAAEIAPLLERLKTLRAGIRTR